MTDSEQRGQATPEEIERIKAANTARRVRINAEVAATVRMPFARLIADYLECQPTPEALQVFANRFPDRFASALAQLAPLAGYRKEISVSGDIHIIPALPDSALHDRLLQAEVKLQELQQRRMLGISQQPITEAIETSQDSPQAMPSKESIEVQREETSNAMQGHPASQPYKGISTVLPTGQNTDENQRFGDEITILQDNDPSRQSQAESDRSIGEDCESTMLSLTRIPPETRHSSEFEQSIIDI